MIIQTNTASASGDDIEKLDQAIEALSGNRPQPPQPVHHLQSVAPRSSQPARTVDVNRSPGRFFDVIGSRPSNISSNLRTPEKITFKQITDTDNEEPELLPEHAGLSYNEKPTSPDQAPEIEEISTTVNSQNINIGGQFDDANISEEKPTDQPVGPTLDDFNNETDFKLDYELDDDINEEKQLPKFTPNNQNKSEEDTEDEDEGDLTTSLSSDSNKTSNDKPIDVPKSTVSYSPTTSSPISSNKPEPKFQTNVNNFQNNGILTPAESMPEPPARKIQKPTVFDTHEYHSSLPTEVKEKSGHSLIIGLLVVTMISSLASLVLLILDR